jgi:excisionase family DNA binding protein
MKEFRLAALPTFLSMEEAAHQLGVSEFRLRRMINAGTIRAAIIGEETVVSEASIRELTPKEQLPEYTKHIHLRGKVIWISDAARKYGIPNQTIVRWVAKGIIKRVGSDKNKVLIDQADIAYCADIYHARKGQGKWLFNPDGTPYIPRTEKIQIAA